MAAPDPHRVLFVLEYFHPHVGGVETLFAGLTTALADRGIEVTVVTSAVPGAPAEEVWRGVRIIRERVPLHGARYYFTLRSIPTVARLAREHDVVHTTTYNAAIPAWIGARAAQRQAVITVHEVWGRQWNDLLGMRWWVGWLYRAFEWLVLHLPFAEYHCDSEFTRRRLIHLMHVPAERTSVVYPAVDYEFWERDWTPADRAEVFGTGDDSFVYCSFGRPGVSKGLEYLVDAAAAVRRRVPDSRLVMILAHDPANQRRRLRQRIKDRGLDDYATVLDPVPRERLPEVLRAADCVVVPSVSEGFGYSAVESALLGLPVVATTGHSLDEVLADARLVPRRDPDKLSEAIVDVAEGDRNPARPAACYDRASQVAATLAAYAKLGLLDGRAHRSRGDDVAKIKTHFNMTPADYEAMRVGHMQDRRVELLSAVIERMPDGARVLEVGCGTGGLAAALARRFPAAAFHGVDIDEPMIAFAQVTHRLPNATFAVDDITKSDPGESYDLVISIDLIHHLHDHLAGFKAVRARLRAGGRWVAMEPNIWQPYVTLQQERMRRAGFDEDHFRPWKLVPVLRQAGFRVDRRRFVQAFPASVKHVPPLLGRVEKAVERVPFIGGSVAYELSAV